MTVSPVGLKRLDCSPPQPLKNRYRARYGQSPAAVADAMRACARTPGMKACESIPSAVSKPPISACERPNASLNSGAHVSARASASSRANACTSLPNTSSAPRPIETRVRALIAAISFRINTGRLASFWYWAKGWARKRPEAVLATRHAAQALRSNAAASEVPARDSSARAIALTRNAVARSRRNRSTSESFIKPPNLRLQYSGVGVFSKGCRRKSVGKLRFQGAHKRP